MPCASPSPAGPCALLLRAAPAGGLDQALPAHSVPSWTGSSTQLAGLQTLLLCSVCSQRRAGRQAAQQAALEEHVLKGAARLAAVSHLLLLGKKLLF